MRPGPSLFSADGLAWTRGAAPTTRTLRGAAYGNGTYVVAGDWGSYFTSPDGVTWTPKIAGTTDFRGIAFGDGKFLITTSSGGYHLSSDGVNFETSGSLGTVSNFHGAAYIDSKFVYWGGTSVRFSSDGGTTWTDPASPGVGELRGITRGDGLWVAGGQNGIATSPDGMTWTVAAGGNVRLVAFGNGRFVAKELGLGGALLTSEDGLSWTKANGLYMTGSGVAFGNGRFVMAGGGLQASEDGVSWQALSRGALRPDLVSLIPPASTGNPTLLPAWKSFRDREGVNHVLPLANWGQVASGSNLFVGAGGAAFLEENNFSQRLDLQTQADLHAVGVSTASNSTAVVGGAGGVIRTVKLSGSTFNGTRTAAVTPLASPTTRTLRSGYAGHLVGDGGTIIRVDNPGQPSPAIAVEPSGTAEDLRHIDRVGSGSGPNAAVVIAVGNDGTLLVREANNPVWHSRTTGTTADLVGVSFIGATQAYGRFVAVGEDGTVISSADTLTWRSETPVRAPGRLTQFRNGYLVGEDGFYAFAQATPAGIHFSYQQNSILADRIDSVAIGAGRTVALAGSFAGASFDGRAWTVAATPAPLTKLAFGGGRFVALGGATTSGAADHHRIHHSPDGLHWTAAEPTDRTGLTAIAYGGGRFAAGGAGSEIWTSDDGHSWTRRASGLNSRGIEAMAFGNGIFMGAGTSGNVVTSTDGGLTWTSRGPFGSDPYKGVAFGNGRFVAVGHNGRVVRTDDGISFTSAQISHLDSSTGNRPFMESIAFTGTEFIAATSSGQAFVSPDGVTWEERFTGIPGPLTGAVAGNGMVIFSGGGTMVALATGAADAPFVVAQPQDAALVEGDTLELSATVTGGEPLELQWLHDGEPLEDGGSVSGSRTADLRISGMTSARAGEYRLVVSNASGSRSSRAAAVGVTDLPVILSHPEPVILAAGQELVLTVEATGADATYQWLKNGAPLDGRTEATLNLPSVAAGDAALYAVRVTNAAGSATSHPAAVSVTTGSMQLTATLDAAFNAAVPQLRPVTMQTVVGSFSAFQIQAGVVDSQGRLLVAGQFEYTAAGDATRYGIVRLDADGTLDETFQVPDLRVVSGAFQNPANVQDVAVLADGRILLVGAIDLAGGVAVADQVLLEADGSRVSGFNVTTGASSINTVAVDGAGRILMGMISPATLDGHKHISRRLLPNGTADSSFDTSTIPIAQPLGGPLLPTADGGVIFAGYTPDYSKVMLHKLAEEGSVDPGFAAIDFGLQSVSHLSATESGRFLAAGSFTTVNGVARPGVALFEADGTPSSGFAGPATGGSFAVDEVAHLGGGFSLVAGTFSSLTEAPGLANVAVLEPDGSVLAVPAFGTGTDASATMAAAGAGSAYFAGNFTTLAGAPVGKIVKLQVETATAGDIAPLGIIAASPGRSFTEGERVVLSVAATGGQLSFRWFRGTEELAGETSSQLVLGAAEGSDAGSYRVEVSDASGTVESGPIVLSLSDGNDAFGFWAAGLPPGSQGRGDDPDGDGLANVLEFLLGLDPSDHSGGDPVIFASVNASGEAIFTFRTAKAAAGETFEVQTSLDLTDFAAGNVPTDLTESGEDENFIYWQATVTPPAGSGGAFLRLAVAAE